MNTSSFCHGIVDIDGSNSIGICEKVVFNQKPKSSRTQNKPWSISQNTPQLDQFVRFQCFVKTPPLQFWAKNAQTPQRC